jgi:hypothetical protein
VNCGSTAIACQAVNCLVGSNSQMFQPLRRFLFSSHAIWFYVAMNAAIFVAIAAWIFSDARFGEAADRLRAHLSSQQGITGGSINDPRLAASVLRLEILLTVAVVSGLLIGAAAILGTPHHRRIPFWLGLIFVAAVWLTLWATWPKLMWSGQVFRLTSETAAFQSIAKSLNNNWPDVDGSRDHIGPFNAYPAGEPRVLQLLTERRLPSGSATFSLIERINHNSLGFGLTGRDPGAWLEWHPSGDLPHSYIGGLAQRHDLARYEALGDNWYLVRYQ